MPQRFARIEPGYPSTDAEINGVYSNQPSPARLPNPPPGKLLIRLRSHDYVWDGDVPLFSMVFALRDGKQQKKKPQMQSQMVNVNGPKSSFPLSYFECDIANKCVSFI